MLKNIRFKGMSLARDEQNVQPGELAYCDGVEVHDGALRPTVLTGTDIENALVDIDGTPLKLVYVHATTAYTHYICHRETGQHTLAWYDENGNYKGDIQHGFGKIKKIESIGNTLIILSDKSVHYILYKDNEYRYLGNKPPFVTILFNLRDCGAEKYEHGNIDVKNDKGAPTDFALQGVTGTNYFEILTDKNHAFKGMTAGRNADYENIKKEYQADITESVWALLNRTNNYIASKGHFYCNFFVRYCYRMYDGSMIMHSAPIFQPVLMPDNYIVHSMHIYADGTDGKTIYDTGNIKYTLKAGRYVAYTITYRNSVLTLMYMPRNLALQYMLTENGGDITSLKNDWSDIIKSIDIFVTPPLTRDKTGDIIKAIGPQQCKEYTTKGEYLYDFAGGVFNLETRYVERSAVVYLPSMTDKEYADYISNQPAFFKIASINTDELSDMRDFKDVDMGRTSLVNLATFEQMQDDYKSHNDLTASDLYVYNHKLHLLDVSEHLFKGFTAQQLWGAQTNFIVGKNNEYNLYHKIFKIVVRVRTENGIKYVDTDTSGLATMYYMSHIPVFYPDARADYMYIYFIDLNNSISILTIPLTACKELNGAMHVAISPHICDAVGDYADCKISAQQLAITDDKDVYYFNKIYASDMNNPFRFPPEGIITVGTGVIRGIATATRALSQGQFGQYPLMAFASDGIWALSVASNGDYSTVRPISREVCDNADSICQIDQSVVFATKKGIFKIAEVNVASFSDILDGPYFSLDRLNRIEDIKQNYKAVGDTVYLMEPAYYYRNASVRYDYCNGRLLLIPHSVPGESIKIYVYSITDDAWSTLSVEQPLAVLNGYPYLYWQDSTGKVKVFDRPYSYKNGKVYSGMILTRTLTYSAAMCSIGGFDQQTDSARRQTLFVWGSNDNRTWHYVGMSSRRHADYIAEHPFRYFRLMIITELTEADKYYDITLDVKSKYAKI